MSPEQIVRQTLEYFNSPLERERYLELYAPHATLHGYQGVEPGLAGIQKFYQAFWEAFPDVKVRIEDLFTNGDRLACRFTLTATHQGTFQGIPATGNGVAFSGITILRFEDGKCVERWSQSDFLGLLAQLGVKPS